MLLLASVVCAADPFLASWMAQLSPVLGAQTIFDLALPGTHDSSTADLDLVISDGGIDDNAALAEILHVASELHILPSTVLEFVRDQAHTQSLSLPQQLDAGMRFIDFRVMKEDSTGDWRSLHMLQTKQSARVYLAQVKAWLVAHPGEVGASSMK